VSPEAGGCSDRSQTSKEATEARLESLAQSVRVRKARARAEVTFRKAELKAAADWHRWHKDRYGTTPLRDGQPLPPHWHAGILFACAVISANSAAALDQIPHPADFEKFLRECVWVIAESTYLQKLAEYDGAATTNLRRTVGAFHRHVSTAMAPAMRQLSLEAWRRVQLRLEGEPLDLGEGECEISMENAKAARADPLGAELADHNLDLVAKHRESRLQAFLVDRGATVAAVRKVALVQKPDMQRWRHGKLSDKSAMAQRIEKVLSGHTSLKRP
jgi:hypothetical protein